MPDVRFLRVGFFFLIVLVINKSLDNGVSRYHMFQHVIFFASVLAFYTHSYGIFNRIIEGSVT